MYKFRIDDTGEDFNSLNELCKVLRCVPSNIWWWRKHHSDSKRHFWYQDFGITILEFRRPDWEKSEKCKATRKKYYNSHKEYYAEYQKKWNKTHQDKRKEYKKKWNALNREWISAYYREYRKRKKEEQ